MGCMVQKYIVEDAKKASPLMPQHIALVDPNGEPVQLGGSAPANDSITTAMLKNACVTNMKVEADAIGEVNIKNGAVTAAKLASGVLPGNATKAKAGLVKQGAKVDDCSASDVNGCKASINALLKSLRDAGVLATS